jgi:hypothetical protein
MAKKNYARTQMVLKRLYADKQFQELRQAAQKDPKHTAKYVDKARKIFNLSGYWEEFLPAALKSDDVKPEGLATASILEHYTDMVTGQYMGKITVYPETTLEDVKRMFTVAQIKFEQRGIKKKRRRTSKRYDIEILAAQLSEQGLTSAEIAEQLDSSEHDVTVADVPDLIAKGKIKTKDI